MITFTQLREGITKPAAGKLGDCYEVAGRDMLDLDDKMAKAGYKMVHTFVRGEGPLEGRRFGHAFNMFGDLVFDNSNGKKIMMRKANYFKKGDINPKEKGAYVEYDKKESLLKLAKYKHWGPWDLDESLAEEIPDESREIGKKKLRISPKILLIIKNKIK